MDCYLTLPFSELKLQELVDEAKDFMYALGKEIKNMVYIDCMIANMYLLCCLFSFTISDFLVLKGHSSVCR